MWHGVKTSLFRTMAVKALLLSTIVCLGSAWTSAAQARGWTVYISNTCNNNGWIRTGFSHDLYTTESACKNSVAKRVTENRSNGTNNENFAIVYQNSSPPSGALRSFVRGYVEYSSGKCSSPKTCLYYAKVRYYGRVGYLGGYKSAADAQNAGRQWVRGVGAGASFLSVYGPVCQ